MGKSKDLTNQRFYHMVALERTHKPNENILFGNVNVIVEIFL